MICLSDMNGEHYLEKRGQIILSNDFSNLRPMKEEITEILIHAEMTSENYPNFAPLKAISF
jgi:hypothetical protein